MDRRKVFAGTVRPCYTCRMTKPATTPWDTLNLPFLRFTGRHLPAAQQLLRGRRDYHWPIEPLPPAFLSSEDISLIDPDLPLVRPRDPNLLLSPGYRSTFRSLTAEQRWAYNQWLREHSSPAPAGYAYLYVMLLEAALFDEHALAALAELRWLVDEARTASIHEFALFSLACGAWLHRQIETFEWLVEQQTVLTYYINPMLSFQADLQIPLSAQQAINLAPHISYSWNSWARQHPDAVEAALAEELAAGDQPFLAAHQARMAPQPMEIRLLNHGLAFSVNICDFLSDEPFRHSLHEVLRLSERAAQLGGHFTRRSAPTTRPTQWVDRGWYLVLEFEDTTSDKLDRALRIARRHPGYIKLLDENRQIVHRVLYRRRDLLLFWSLFERVRNWKSTRVYVNGNPVSLEYLWPESPALML